MSDKTNPANSQAKSGRSHLRWSRQFERKYCEVAHRQRLAVTGFLMQSAIESKDMKKAKRTLYCKYSALH